MPIGTSSSYSFSTIALETEDEYDEEDEHDKKEQCRLDAIADLKEFEKEPNCLDLLFPIRAWI